MKEFLSLFLQMFYSHYINDIKMQLLLYLYSK